ncbi:MAG: hypothetical protein GX417_01570 [Clostridiales bacterium]|nr:hypothetical protein [Clostridiales bacterium]
MPTIFIILAIIWIIVPILAKKRQQQAKAEAERQRAARQHQPQQAAAQRAPQPMRTAPIAPRVSPSHPSFQPSVEGVGSEEGRSGAVLQGEQPHDVAATLSEAKTSLTQLRTSASHIVTASSESGHTHQETSATGILPDCPPDKAAAAQAVAAPSVESAFLWDASQVRSGLVMGEILGPCLALRD